MRCLWKERIGQRIARIWIVEHLKFGAPRLVHLRPNGKIFFAGHVHTKGDAV